jgi:hypothetical protein
MVVAADANREGCLGFGRHSIVGATTRDEKKLLTFTKLQFVEDGGLSGGIETDHQDTHLFLAELS